MGFGLDNLLAPPVLFFLLGFAAALAKSDLAVPDAIGKALSLYLMLAIGLKGGMALAVGSGEGLAASLAAGVVMSFALPFLAFAVLYRPLGLDRPTAAAVAGHYGSVSVVTFAAATTFVTAQGLAPEPYMPAVLALMEVPAIVSALWLARRGQAASVGPRPNAAELVREVALSGSIVVLIGSFIIGAVIPPAAAKDLSPFVKDIFPGILCIFLLDIGIIAGRQLAKAHQLKPALIAFGLIMPLVGSSVGLAAGIVIGLSPGGVALFAVLAASASYIAVPAVMRVALPEANPAVYMTLSLGITFPFNILVGIPLYTSIARSVAGG
ncbi:MAG: sodium-dependent bicarbonate transport family permease [Rhodospirillaceae bacterium]|nr:sodium-dependent bicarbonate transport family permease [Rhodospirillaceae bacterium]